MLCCGAILAHVLAARCGEHPRCDGERELVDLRQRLDVTPQRRLTVLCTALQRAGLHLLEAERDRAVDEATADRLRGQEQRRRTRRAVVVDVGDRDARHAQFVKGTVARRGVNRAVTDEALLHLGIVDAGIPERFRARFSRHIGVVPPLAAARLLELRHPDPDHKNLVWHVTTETHQGANCLGALSTRHRAGEQADLRYASASCISNTNSWSQIRMRSPSERVTLAPIRSPRTSTPLADRRSETTKLVPVSMITAWWRLTFWSSRTMSLSGNLPIRVAAAVSGYSWPDASRSRAAEDAPLLAVRWPSDVAGWVAGGRA